MSSAALCKLAGEIGYRPTDRKLTADSLDWMFVSNEPTKAFLHWFCGNITQKNLLTDAEIQEFTSLQQQSLELSGSSLDEAYKDLTAVQSRDEEEELEKEIAILEAQLSPLKKEVQLLSRRHAKLEERIESTKKRNIQLTRLLASRKDSFSKTIHPRLSHRVLQLDAVSGNLESTSMQIIESCAEALSNAGSSSLTSCFLSTSSWSDYKQKDELYSKQVRLYMRRLMAEEGSETTNSGGEAQNESDRHFWLRVRDPRIVRFRGVDTETHARHSNELARLKAVFAPSESARTAAELELARRTAEVETLKIQLMSEQSMASSFDSNAIKHKIREIEKKHARIATLLARNVDIILPELYAELAKLQSTPILWADYNLKFSRLHFQRAKIDKVLQSLLRQRSKNVLLAHALEEEKQQHLRLYALMNAYHSDVSQFSKEWSNRIDVLQRANDNHLPPALLTATLSRVHQLLTGTTAFNLQKMKSKAKEQAEIKKSLCDDGISQLESSELGRLRQSVDHFYAVLYKDHHGKHPHMTSPLVAEACRKTESATSKLASSLECLLKEYTSRSRAISELPKELQFERNLWVKFYGGSSQAKQLRAAFDEIKSGHASGLLLT